MITVYSLSSGEGEGSSLDASPEVAVTYDIRLVA